MTGRHGWLTVALALALSACQSESPLPQRAATPARTEVLKPGEVPKPGQSFKDCPDCPEMLVIPAGSFLMGAADGSEEEIRRELGRLPPPPTFTLNPLRPVHRVTFARPFALGRYEVTVGEFAVFVRENPGALSGDPCLEFFRGAWMDRGRPGKSWRDPGFTQTESHPVVCISDEDARADAEWLSRKTGKPYRLPSEAEWEYAARAGSTTVRFWGDNADSMCGYANAADATHKQGFVGALSPFANCADSFVYTAPIGSLRPNTFGLYDMLGNVWEWVEDCVHESYAGAPEDGTAWLSGCTSKSRIIRGGSWYAWTPIVTSAFRVGSGGRLNGTGFRLARPL